MKEDECFVEMLVGKVKRRLQGEEPEPVPRPIRTAQIMTFWSERGCKSEIGHEIKVLMFSGRTAVFKLTNIEYPFGTGLDWQWHDYEFVRYL